MGECMGKKRVRPSADFKGQVALEALKRIKSVNELAGQYQIHPTQISQWNRQVQGHVNELFTKGSGKGQLETDVVQAKLYEEVGRLKMVLGWIKKPAGLG